MMRSAFKILSTFLLLFGLPLSLAASIGLVATGHLREAFWVSFIGCAISMAYNVIFAVAYSRAVKGVK